MKSEFITHSSLDRSRLGPAASAADQALKIISIKLHERMSGTAAALSGGSCKDYSEYRHLCGVLQGLALAEREIIDLSHAMEQGNDD